MEEIVYIPSNLYLEKLLIDNPPDFKYDIDYFKYIISLITEIPAYNKDMLKNYNYVLVNAEELQRKVHDYSKYRRYLLKHKILETDNHYIVSEKSKGYRFTALYRTPVKPDFITKYTLVKSIRKTAPAEDKLAKKYSYLRKWYNEHLKIDVAAAMKYIEKQKEVNIKKGDENAMLKYNSSYIIITRISEQNFYFKIDDNVHRLHTPLSNIKSELRNFITYNGVPLVAVDFKNSQLCLSAVLMDEKFYKKSVSGSINPLSFNIFNISNHNSSFSSITSTSTTQYIYSYIMLVKDEEANTGQGFQPFITKAEKGLIYEYIKEIIEKQTNMKIEDRQKLKEIVFTVLFTDNRFIGQLEALPKRIFRKIFPAVFEVFKMIKKKDSTILPRLLQTIESKLMLDNIAKRITGERLDMPFFTIHDSVVCPKGEERYIADVMKEEMAKAIGVHPSVKYDYWTPANLA